MDALQRPTSRRLGGQRETWAGRAAWLTLETPSNPSHTVVAEGTLAGTLAGTPFASRTWGLILLIDSGTPSIRKCESLCSLAVGASLNSQRERHTTATYVYAVGCSSPTLPHLLTTRLGILTDPLRRIPGRGSVHFAALQSSRGLKICSAQLLKSHSGSIRDAHELRLVPCHAASPRRIPCGHTNLGRPTTDTAPRPLHPSIRGCFEPPAHTRVCLFLPPCFAKDSTHTSGDDRPLRAVPDSLSSCSPRGHELARYPGTAG